MIAVGIDVSKEKLDIWMNNKLTVILNKVDAIKDFFKPYQDQELHIVMEATGRLHRDAHKILNELRFTVTVINPFQSRHFAKAMNVICKTDKVDARVLCLYAERMPLTSTPALSDLEEKMQNLIRHLDDLKETRKGYDVRLKETKGFAAESLKRVIDTLKEEIKSVEKHLSLLSDEDEDLKKKKAILTSIPGVGEATALAMLGLMRELGSLKRNQACALAGLAPMNYESGKMQGKRRIQKGRHDLRSHLYMPMLGAVTKHNAVFKAFYERLVRAGKAPKVALVAVMRKLIVIANGLLQRQEYWRTT
jgi:transposase